ncbi:MAG: hypothetical protein ACQESR_20635, partial [Planctomycetota bacterium]
RGKPPLVEREVVASVAVSGVAVSGVAVSGVAVSGVAVSSVVVRELGCWVFQDLSCPCGLQPDRNPRVPFGPFVFGSTRARMQGVTEWLTIHVFSLKEDGRRVS